MAPSQSTVASSSSISSSSIKVRCNGVMNLPKMDRIGTCDPYLVLKMGSQEHKTKVVKNSLNASWDEEFSFQGDGELTVTVMDWDMLSKDELVGSASLSIKDYLASGGSEATFVVLGEEGRAVQGVEGPTMLSLTFTPMDQDSNPVAATPMQTRAAATPATAPATGAAPHSHAGSSPLPSPTAFFDDGEDPALNDNNSGSNSNSNSMVAPPQALVPAGGRAGIGIKCVAVDGWLVVKAVKPGSPSDRGGVRVGDKLERVNGVSISSLSGASSIPVESPISSDSTPPPMSFAAALASISGPPSTKVSLSFIRPFDSPDPKPSGSIPATVGWAFTLSLSRTVPISASSSSTPRSTPLITPDSGAMFAPPFNTPSISLAATAASAEADEADRVRQLVQDSWARVEPDIEEHGVKFFMRIFEIAPPALQLFSFKDEVQLEQSPAMRAHASVVMRTVGQAVAGLSDLQTLVPVLQKLGAGHAEYNVQPEHFAIVGSSLLWTLEIGLSGAGAWTPEVKDAWSKTYATVQSVMEPALTAEIQKRNAMKLATAQAAQTLKTGIVVAGVMASKAKEVGGSSKTEGLPKEGESSSSSRQSAAETSPNDPIAVVEAKVGVAGVGQALHPEAEEKLAQEAQQHPSHRRKSSGGGSSSEHLVDMSYRNNACNGREEGDTVSQMSSERSHGGGLGDDDDDYDDDDDEVSSSDEGGGDYETSSDDDSSEDEEAGSEGRAGRKSGMRTPKGRGGCSSPSGESPVTELTKRSPRPAASAEHQMVPPICPPALSLGSGGPAHRTNNAGGGSPKVTPPLKSDMELLEGMLCEDASAARARISKSRGGVRDPSLSLVSSIAPKGEWGTDSGIKIKTVRSSNKDREWDCFVEDDDCVTDDRSLAPSTLKLTPRTEGGLMSPRPFTIKGDASKETGLRAAAESAMEAGRLCIYPVFDMSSWSIFGK